MTGRLEAMLAGGRDDAMLRFGLGSAYAGSGDEDKAIVHLEACILQDESYSAAYKLLGRLYFKRGEFTDARRVLSAGITAAQTGGDKQSEREMQVFLTRTERAAGEAGSD